ncbi:immunoglobulin A1 protease autotransporter [Zeugodacus cucurbitae]|uniref:immunoglobulin A1 protease autotransporter n=1 Tax=Zeugodacus cucurbitae TaxID=28588 RepID=UPI0023D93DBA|nr:immunoglobulin A1 protease autotransporter [Zeugodacus cucurbitae]
MSWWKQVRCALALADMNDGSNGNGNCSCHKQRRCNRLTCYRNGNSSGSNQPKALPLFITVAILALAVTPIDAAVIKRSIAETTTDLNSTTPYTPLATNDETDSTTVNTPLLANNSTTIENVQHNTAATEPEMTTIGSSTVRHDDQMLTSQTRPDVNNEIAQVVSEESATDLRVKANPKFDYVETVLNENLEDSIRNSVRNEIEFEQDIVAAEVQHQLNVTDEEERQKLADEVQLIQSALQESSTKSSAAFDVLAELTSTTADTVREQLSTTESTTLAHSKSVSNDLSVLFPVQTEETSRSTADNQRGARNLNIHENENTEILNDHSETNLQFNEDDGMQNIEEDKVDAQDGALDADKSSLQAQFSRISDSALYSHEANEIDAEGIIQRESSSVLENQHYEDDTKLEDENTSTSTEQHSASSVENNLSNESSQPSASPSVVTVESHETSSSSASNEIVDTTQEHSSTQTTENHTSAVNLNESTITPAATDEASLSIVLDENLNATEATTALAAELPEDLLQLDESDALANEEVATTAEPESVKSVHTVIKKQGVELDEVILEPVPLEPVEETTASVDIVKEELLEREETTAKATVTSVNDVDIEKEQSLQNDDAANETSLPLDDKDDDQAVSEPIETITGQVVDENIQTNIEVDTLNEDNNQIDAKSSEVTEHDDQVVDSNSNPKTNEGSTYAADKQDALNDNQYLVEINNDISSQTEKSSTTENVSSARVETPTEETEESAILVQAEKDNEITQRSSTTESMIETEDNGKMSSSTTERTGQMHISLLGTTQLPNAELPHTSTATIDRQSTTLKEIEVIDGDDNNTDDPDIVPLLVGVSTGQGDVTASTKGSRSINTQTHHTMLLTQLDDTMAATLFETFPPHNAGRTLNDHMAAESSGGIGKPLPTRSINEATSASIFSRSGLIIVVCSSIAFMFLLVSVVAFLISFQRQHGTLDIEMQEQRCGKDDLDEEDEEVGTCTKLLEIELPKSTIVSASCEELEECL